MEDSAHYGDFQSYSFSRLIGEAWLQMWRIDHHLLDWHAPYSVLMVSERFKLVFLGRKVPALMWT